MFRPSVVVPPAALLACLVALWASASAEGKNDKLDPVAIPTAVKSDYLLFVHLDAKAVRESALFADVKSGFTSAGGAAEWDQLWELFDRKFDLGISPVEIDSVTFCVTELPEDRGPLSVVIVTSNKPVKKAGVLGFKPNAKPDARGFYALDRRTFLHFPNDKTVAVLDTRLAEKYLDGFAKNPADWPFTAELSKAASGHTFFAVIRPALILADARKVRVFREFAPLFATRSVTLTAALKGKKFHLAARATFADPIAAGKARHKLHTLLGFLGDGVDELLGGEAVGDLGAMRPAVKEAERAFATARVELDGSDLIASVSYSADFKIDPVTAGAVKYMRETLPRLNALDNLRQLGLGLHNYASANVDRLLIHGTDANGAIKKPTDKPLLSWRVTILPFIEQDELYKQFKLDEPWDSEHNKKLIAKMPKVFAPLGKPGKPGYTHLQMVIGPAAMTPGKYTMGNIPDGTSNTIAVVEAAEPVIWTKPDDVMFPGKELPKDFRKKFGGQFSGGFHALLWDGSARFVPDSVTNQTLGYALCPDDGQVLGSDWR
jgi:hypothetical protein